MTHKQKETLAAMTARAGLPGNPEERRLGPGGERQTEHQLRTLVEGVPHLIWRSCNRGHWTWASPQWRAYTGQNQNESLGRGWLHVVHPEDREQTIAAWVVATANGELDVEFRVLRASDGIWIWHRTTSLPVRDDLGNIIEWLGSTTDIQRFKELQADQAEALKALKNYAEDLKSEIDRREQAEARLQKLAYHDDLTGLRNRAWFMAKLEELAEAGDASYTCSLLFIDLDRFKPVNDTFGHTTGDRLLVEVGHRLQSCINDQTTLMRLGGDEFAMLIEGDDCISSARLQAQRIRETMSQPFLLGTREVSTSCSIGIAHAVPGYSKLDELVRDAGFAMYDAKANGFGGCAVFTTTMREHAAAEFALTVDLRHAISNADLALLYQPISDVETSAIVGVEALIRWRHAERGEVPPSLFIPVAEKAGLIRDLGRWVFRTACFQMRLWHERFPSLELFLSVNASGEELRDHQYVVDVKEHLAATCVDPGRLQVEVTEGVFLRQPDTTGEILDALRAHGIRVALDDFGTGYSSLGYLSRYPVDALKIDRSFISRMLTQRSTQAVVEAVIELGHALNLDVVAEGVEEYAQLDALQQFGCDFVQGYLLGRPLEPADLEKELEKQCQRINSA